MTPNFWTVLYIFCLFILKNDIKHLKTVKLIISYYFCSNVKLSKMSLSHLSFAQEVDLWPLVPVLVKHFVAVEFAGESSPNLNFSMKQNEINASDEGFPDFLSAEPFWHEIFTLIPIKNSYLNVTTYLHVYICCSRSQAFDYSPVLVTRALLLLYVGHFKFSS